jgi:PhnB protein
MRAGTLCDLSVPMSHIDPTAEIQQLFPYLIVRDCPAAIDFYKRVFHAEEAMRLAEPDGRIGHAELKLGAAMIMLAEEHPDRGVMSPLAYGGSGSILHLHVADVDEMTARAVEAGAKLLAEPKTQFYGERSSKIQDPFGHIWMLGQHVEDVSREEVQRRYAALLS